MQIQNLKEENAALRAELNHEKRRICIENRENRVRDRELYDQATRQMRIRAEAAPVTLERRDVVVHHHDQNPPPVDPSTEALNRARDDYRRRNRTGRRNSLTISDNPDWRRRF